MSMTPRELVCRTIRFEGAERFPYDLAPDYGSDIAWVGMDPSVDDRPRKGVDSWGAVWDNVGVCDIGEVTHPALEEWEDWDQLTIPDIREEARWHQLEGARERAGDRFLIAAGVSIYERVHFIRGLENTWMDILEEPEKLGELIDILVDMNLYAIKRFADAGTDAYMWWDDWGLQERLMISPEAWREIWKPRYERIYKAVHDAGMFTILHSCGEITSILDDLIEIGLDVIQMDQQVNMGLERLGREFGGRITFWCPVDIQAVMAKGNPEEIRAYCGEMVRHLGRPEGGFFAKWYNDPVGAGHTPEAIHAMCDEFLKLTQTPSLIPIHG